MEHFRGFEPQRGRISIVIKRLTGNVFQLSSTTVSVGHREAEGGQAVVEREEAEGGGEEGEEGEKRIEGQMSISRFCRAHSLAQSFSSSRRKM